MTGRSRPGPPERVRRLTAVAAAVRTLLTGGSVPAADAGALRDVRLDAPRPVQQPVPLLVGGANPSLLHWAGAYADAVGLSGLGRTLPDGHSHTVHWSGARVDADVEAVREGARTAGRSCPPLEALVQQVTVTDDREAATTALAAELGVDAGHLLAVPYLWIGTMAQIREQVRAAGRRWGITRWVVRADAVDSAAAVLAG